MGSTVGFGGFGNSLSAEDGASASSPNALQGLLVDSCLASAAVCRWIDVSSEADAHGGCCGAHRDSLALRVRSPCEEPWRSMGDGYSAPSSHHSVRGPGACKCRAGERPSKRWCGRRDLNPHGPFKPCGFSCRLRLSPPGCEAFRRLTPGLRSGLSLHPPPEAPELRCCPSSLYTFPAGISPGLARDCYLRFPGI